MKKIISMLIIATAMISTTSCDKDGLLDPDSYDLSGDKYIGRLTVLGEDQEDITFYAEQQDGTIDIMMPEVSFMPGLMPSLNMAFISIPLVNGSSDTYFIADAQMVGIYDHLPLINDVIQSISNVSVKCSDNTITVSFDCAISTDAIGDMTVTVSYIGYTDDYVEPDPEFSLDNDEGFYITTSSGAVLLSSASVTYYEGNNALVIDGFSYSANLSTTTLPIIGVVSNSSNGMTTLTADGLEASYTFMGMDTSGTVTGLTCEIIEDKAQMVFTISASMGGSAPATDYPCTFNGDITISSEIYEVIIPEPEFTLDYTEGFNITISTGATSTIDGVTVTYYTGDNTLVVDGFKFNSATPMGATLAINSLTASTENSMTTITGSGMDVDYSIMGQPCTSEISDLTCEIIGEESQLEFWIMYNSYNYPCTYNGAITIVEGNYESEEETETPEFSLDNDEGFYITTSSGVVLLTSATVTYYVGNNAIVIDGFSYSAYLSTTTLPIIGVTSETEGGMAILTADNLTVDYTFMTLDTSGTVTGLRCEIVEDKAQMVFTISAAMGNSTTASDYPCTFNGDITINTGSYSAE
ncbi:MAG: hypothetical protein R3Y22_04320 [Bacteroidales bacterium]